MSARWILMTPTMRMPSTVRARYLRVVAVKLTEEYAAKNLTPAMASERARGVERLIDYGHHNVGKNIRSAFAQKKAEAEADIAKLNRGEKL